MTAKPKKSYEELQQMISNANEQIKLGSRCYHYKDSGKFYTIVDFVIIQEIQEVGVIYEAEYMPGINFVRPISEFFDELEFEGEKRMRFTFI